MRVRVTAAALSCLGIFATSGCGGTINGADDAADHGAIVDGSTDVVTRPDATTLDGADAMDDVALPMPDARDDSSMPMPDASDIVLADAADVADVVMPPPMNIYFGTTHMHTGCCNNHGEANMATAAQVFTAAKANPTRFDFMFLTEHSGSTGPASVPMDPATFYANTIRTAMSLTDSTFVGFVGFEYSDNDGGGGVGSGHMTAANTADFMTADGPSNASTLEDYLVRQAAAGRPAYGGFNHPDATGHPGAAAALLTPARREVIVMNEVHNSYESGADATHFQSLIAALDHGWRVAPTCGLDGHGTFRAADTRPEPGPCRTGVLAPSLTRADLDAAFMARRFYSSRDINMRVSYTANGFWMGSQIGTPTTVAFDISVSDPDTGNAADKIKRIDILTDGGAMVSTRTFDAHSVTWRVSVPANNHHYFLLRIFNGERTTYTAATAPVWLE